jgi:hypothetical protein
VSGPILDYKGPSPRQEAQECRGTAGIGTGISLLLSAGCLAVPIVGLCTENGPLFLSGLPLCFFGFLLSVIPAYAHRQDHAIAGVGAILCVANGAPFAYFVWLFFVHGLC